MTASALHPPHRESESQEGTNADGALNAWPLTVGSSQASFPSGSQLPELWPKRQGLTWEEITTPNPAHSLVTSTQRIVCFV